MSTSEALDRAFAGEACELVFADSTSKVMAVARWQGDATQADHELFVDRCHGPTLDVGCGPGRLAGALADRGLDVMGIDISQEAVRRTRERGAPALQMDFFDEDLATRTWDHVLLADGNVGIGGDPVRLLRRVADLLAPGGATLVELAPTAGGVTHEEVRMRVGHQMSVSFNWTTVGIDAIEDLARQAGLMVTDISSSADRCVATLRHRSDRLITGLSR